MTQTRRTLVLTSEASRHPYRMSLPPHVLMPIRAANDPEHRRSLRLDSNDLRSFVNAYCAIFAMVLTFIA